MNPRSLRRLACRSLFCLSRHNTPRQAGRSRLSRLVSNYTLGARSVEGVSLFYSMAKEIIETTRFTYASPNGNIEGFRCSAPTSFSKPVIYCRGGNRSFGAVDEYIIETQLQPLARAGFTVYATQYAGGPNSDGKDEFGGSDVDDVLALFDVIQKDIPFERGDFLGIVGFSRGVMEACLAMQRGLPVTTAAFISGVYDLRNIVQERPDIADMITRDQLFDLHDIALAKRSPLAFVDQLPEIPYLLLHTTQDDRVDIAQAIDMADALGKSAVLKTFPGDDHGLFEIADTRNQMIIDWFTTTLQPRH